MNNYLIHYGTPKHSGRYPYGSGKNPYQRTEKKKHGLFKKKPKLFNSDGTLTEYGVQKYRSYSSKPQVTLGGARDRPIPKVSEGDQLYRIASKKENVNGSGRKYVTVTDKDRQLYRDYAYEGYFEDPDGNTPVENVYSAKKDFRIATGEEVVDHILKEYGDQYVNDAYKIYNSMKDLPYVYSGKPDFSKKDLEFIKKVQNTYDDAVEFVRDSLQSSLFKKQKISSNILSYYSDLGYDAIVDAEDWFDSFTDYPLIVINPVDSMRYVETNKLYDE